MVKQINIIDAVIEFCEKNITQEALDYFYKRNWKDETIKKWKLGFFPSKKISELLSIVLKYKLDKNELIDKCIINEQNKTMFFNRVMFPIYNVHGEAIAIAGRTLTADIKPKYLNSDFQKVKNLYGLDKAIEDIRKNDRVYVFEGYADVITSHQCGIQNSVCCMGTAFGLEHYILLSRYASNIFLIFDSDAGGKGAIKSFNKKDLESIDKSRILETKNKEVNVYMATLNQGKDPDEFLLKTGRDNFLDLIEKQKKDFVFQKKMKEI